MPTINAEKLARLPSDVRKAFFASLTRQEKEELAFRWDFWARDKQIAPSLVEDWQTWLILAGRGFGKSRCGAEWVRHLAETQPGCRIALVARTAADYRDVMVEGESGILAVCPPWNRPTWNPSNRKLTWKNGSVATCYTSEKPDQLRGPQHHYAWLDEFAAWRFLDDTYSNLLMGLRLGDRPRACITTTPRPLKELKAMVKDPAARVVTGSTYENLSNLAATFRSVISRYEGTSLGRQELEGIILDDTAGALWTQQMIVDAFYKPDFQTVVSPHDPDDIRSEIVYPEFSRIVVAVDPAVTSNENSDMTGIIVAALGMDDYAYVLEDLTMKASTAEWTQAAVDAYHKWHADVLVGETNITGDLLRDAILAVDRRVNFQKVHARHGKSLRAEPVSSLYEQRRIRHIGTFAELENQMTDWIPATAKFSPDRVDALVYALTELMLRDGNSAWTYTPPLPTSQDSYF